MPLAQIHTRALSGLDAAAISVEVHISGGLPALSIVGLPEAAVREAKDRVRSALMNAGFDFPARRITINLAPANLPKEGSGFDLAIALGILVASGQLVSDKLIDYEIFGELALSGAIRPIRGALPAALAVSQSGHKTLVPADNADEAALAEAGDIYAAEHLLQVVAHLNGSALLSPHTRQAPIANVQTQLDISDVRGQDTAKRALTITAAGGHGMLMLGPPGSGKSMLAQRLPGLLPPMTAQEALASATVTSISTGGFQAEHWMQRPFRAPHHTASAVALVGGGSNPKPGEISLAHHGVLFLDELPEFSRNVLEVLREPLENGRIHISRAARHAEFPAQFQLISAMNPCPCGYLGEDRCRCNAEQIARYRARISGPLLDRIDLHLQVPRLKKEELLEAPPTPAPTSAEVRQQVTRARQTQLQRSGVPNAQLNTQQVEKYCQPDAAGKALLSQALSKLGLSARGYHRILKVARTIADLAEREAMNSTDIAEAISYRSLDRQK